MVGRWLFSLCISGLRAGFQIIFHIFLGFSGPHFLLVIVRGKEDCSKGKDD